MRSPEPRAHLFTVVRLWRDIDRTRLAMCEPLGAAPGRLGHVYAEAPEPCAPGDEVRLAPPPIGPLGRWSPVR